MIKVKPGYVGHNHIWKSHNFNYLEIDECEKINRDIFNGPVFEKVIDGKRLVNCNHFYRYRFLLNKNTEVFKVIDDEFIKIIENGRAITKENYMYHCNRITQPYYHDINIIIIQNYHDMWTSINYNNGKTECLFVIISLVFDIINKKFKVILNRYEQEIHKNDKIFTFYDNVNVTKEKINEINKKLDQEINNNEYIRNLKLDKIFKRIDHWMKVITPNGDIKIFELKFNREASDYYPFEYNQTSNLLRALLWHGKEYLGCDPQKCLYELSNSMKNIKFEDIIMYYETISIFSIDKDMC